MESQWVWNLSTFIRVTYPLCFTFEYCLNPIESRLSRVTLPQIHGKAPGKASIPPIIRGNEYSEQTEWQMQIL